MAASPLFNTIHARASVREFDKDRKILEEVTKQILLAGMCTICGKHTAQNIYCH